MNSLTAACIESVSKSYRLHRGFYTIGDFIGAVGEFNEIHMK